MEHPICECGHPEEDHYTENCSVQDCDCEAFELDYSEEEQ